MFWNRAVTNPRWYLLWNMYQNNEGIKMKCTNYEIEWWMRMTFRQCIALKFDSYDAFIVTDS